MSSRWLVRVLLVAICTMSASCALIFQGSTEEITVTSEPPGATVTLNTGETKTTPFTMTVPRNQDLQLHFQKAGYQPVNIADNSRVEPIAIIVDGIPLMIPWAVDASAGAGYEHQQSTVAAHLTPETGASPTNASDSGATSPTSPSASQKGENTN